MKKVLVLSSLACLLFDAEGMNKKLSSSSSKLSSGQPTLSPKGSTDALRGRDSNPNHKNVRLKKTHSSSSSIGASWECKEVVYTHRNYVELIFQSIEDASKASDVSYKINVMIEGCVEELLVENTTLDRNMLTIYFSDTDSKIPPKGVTYSLEPDTSIAQPIEFHWQNDEE